MSLAPLTLSSVSPTKILNLQESMKTSDEHTRNRTGDSEFNPQLAFSKFMMEARQYASTEEVNQISGASTYIEDEKNSKRSWKTYLLSLWRTERKKKMATEDTAQVPCHDRRSRRGHVSGPIYGSHEEVGTRLQRQTSGHASTAFNLNNMWKRSEDEMPYMRLEQLNNPPHIRSHGPIYLVT